MFAPAAIPAPLADALAVVRACSTDNAREELAGAGPDERAAWLAGLQQLSDAVAAAAAVVLDVFDANGDAQTLHGATSTTSWLRGALRLTSGEASARTQVARSSRTHLAAAMPLWREGTVTEAHVRTIDRQVRRVPAEHQPEAASLLTELGKVAPVAAVRAAGEHLAHVVDPDGTLADCERQFDRRHLTLAPLLDGMTALDGLLDAEAAAMLTAVLTPFLTPTSPEDHRSAAQRRADGLMQVVQSAADHAALPTCGGQRTHLQVVLDPRASASISTAPAVLPQAPGGPATLHPVSLARLACDATMTPLLLDEHGVVISLGRSRRLFSPQQRAVLAARDGGCRWPGCSRPPAHTDAHHLLPWLEGGTTDVPNGLLLCRFHHRQVHEGGWSLAVRDALRGTNGTVVFNGPRGQPLTSDPRGP